jgi:hypothetical protein
MLLLLISCGKQPYIEQHYTSVEPDIEPYFNRFHEKVGINPINISAEFEVLPKPTVGQCLTYSNGVRVIQIDPVYWAMANDDQKEILIFHELGHCALGLGHNANLDGQGCPVSIMYPNTFGTSWCYIYNKPYYFQELASHI